YTVSERRLLSLRRSRLPDRGADGLRAEHLRAAGRQQRRLRQGLRLREPLLQPHIERWRHLRIQAHRRRLPGAIALAQLTSLRHRKNRAASVVVRSRSSMATTRRRNQREASTWARRLRRIMDIGPRIVVPLIVMTVAVTGIVM